MKSHKKKSRYQRRHLNSPVKRSVRRSAKRSTRRSAKRSVRRSSKRSVRRSSKRSVRRSSKSSVKRGGGLGPKKIIAKRGPEKPALKRWQMAAAMVNDEIMKNKEAWKIVEKAMDESKRWGQLGPHEQEEAERVGISSTEWEDKVAWKIVEKAMDQAKRWGQLGPHEQEAAERVGISSTDWEDPELIGSGGWEKMVKAKKAAEVKAVAAVTAQLKQYTPHQMGLSTRPSFYELYEGFKESIGCGAASVSTVCDGLKKRAIQNADEKWKYLSNPKESSAALLGSITAYFYSIMMPTS